MVVQILISGFSQHRGYAHGWYKLRERLLQEGFASGASRRVWLESWRVNTTNLAISLQILQELYGEIKVAIYGYSYGGGYASIELVRRLEKANIPVQKLILADPVFRPRWLPVPLPSPLSLLPFDIQPRIHIPGNVVDLIHFYQNVDLPQSPYLITSNVMGTVEHLELKVSHHEVDDHPTVHDSVLQFAQELTVDGDDSFEIKIADFDRLRNAA